MTEGFCIKTTHSYKIECLGGELDLQNIVKMFRCGFKILGDHAVESVLDHSPEAGSDEIEYRLAGGSSVLLKTSDAGQEITVYISIAGDDREHAEESEKRVRMDIENIIYMDLRAGYCCE